MKSKAIIRDEKEKYADRGTSCSSNYDGKRNIKLGSRYIGVLSTATKRSYLYTAPSFAYRTRYFP